MDPHGNWKSARHWADITSMLRNFQSILLKHALREGNEIADWLASSASNLPGAEHIWTADMPFSILNRCYLDLSKISQSKRV